MTQPTEAVGDATNDTVVAAEPTIEDRFAAAMTDEPVEEQDEPEAQEEPEQPLEEQAEDEPELEAKEEDTDPPIQPPVSLTAEEKEAFKNWPRDAQEAITRRVGELEKGFQAKAQEAAKTRLTVEQEAASWRTSKLEADAKLLQEMLPQIPPKPAARMQIEDPYGYAEQMDQYDWAVAQHNAIVQRYDQIQSELSSTQETMKQQEAQLSVKLLQENFPEYLDPEKGPELRKALGSTALALGYSDDQLAKVDGQDILAMKVAHEWKSKADKYDALMAKQMEKVREAKNLPRVTRPGAAQPRGAVANQRYQADRDAMRRGDKDAAARVFKNFL